VGLGTNNKLIVTAPLAELGASIAIGTTTGGISSTLGDGLIAHYKLNETSGNIAIDSSGNGHDGTSVNTVTSVPGANVLTTNTAWNFNSCSDAIDIPSDSGAFNFGGNNFSISWWEYRTGGYDQEQTALGERTGGAAFLLGYDNGDGTGTILFSGVAAGQWMIAEPFPMTLDAWNHFAFVRNGNNFDLYKNGSSVVSVSSSDSIADLANPLDLGRGQNDNTCMGNGNVSGSLDDVRFYNRALTLDEIAQLAAGTEAE